MTEHKTGLKFDQITPDGEYTGLELPEEREITHFLDVDSLLENPRKEGVE